MTTATTMETLSARLKSGTWDLHQKAESQPFQKSLVKGEVSRAGYAAWLGQMLLVHRVLESRLRELAERDGRVASVVTSEQHQEPYLVADLAALGADAAGAAALPATADLIRTIEEAAEREPIRLLGFHYVLEGSNNGNAFIARAIRSALGLEPGAGDRYLDPYGPRQREVWSAFKTQIDAQGFEDAEQRAMVEAARDMFEGVSAMSVDMSRELAAG